MHKIEVSPQPDLPALLEGGTHPARWPLPVSRAWATRYQRGTRTFLAVWFLACLLIVPSGLLTRIFEWTGIPVSIGGTQVYLTVYLPLIACIPLTLWFGYVWGVVPAYLSTLLVAFAGGMPLYWVFFFALANPVGLAVLVLAYRSLPLRTDLRSLSSFLYFTVTMFVSSLASSVGSLVWAHTNRVGLHELEPIWQGWWLGGFLQAVFLCAPLMIAIGPSVQTLKRRLDLPVARDDFPLQRTILAGGLSVFLGVASYVLAARYFSQLTLERALQRISDAGLRAQIVNVVHSVALPQWVLLAFAGLAILLGYRAGITWAYSLQRLSRQLQLLNRDLEKKANDLEEKNRQLYHLSTTDRLTNVYNRGYLMDTLQRETSRAERGGTPLSCIMLDVDHFKKVNDRFGHLVGDRVLVELSGAIQKRLRKADLLARYGGEEFAVVLPETTSEEALKVAEQLRRVVAELEIKVQEQTVCPTASFGVATRKAGQTDVDLLLRDADDALLRAKARGRNQVVGS